MNIKKIILTQTAIISIAASSCALADGFYAGIGAGASSFNNILSTANNAIASNVISNSSGDMGSTGVIGSLFAGYNFSFANKCNLGLEAFSNIMSTSTTHNMNTTSAIAIITQDLKISSRYTYGLRILPGYEITPDTTGHIILGYARGNFKITNNGKFNNISATFNSNGLQTGLGFTTAITKNLALGLDAIYTTYASQTVNGLTASGTPLTYKNKPYTLEGIVSLQYKFG